jgi:hypothetical protein
MRLRLGRSNAYGRRLVDPGRLDARVERPDLAALLEVDARWPALRPPDAPHAGWAWAPEVKDTDERFALRGDGEILALAAVTKRLPTFDDQRWYRPNVVEVAPHIVSKGLGTAMLALLSYRAAELGCAGLIVESLPDAAPFYLARGAVAPGPGEFLSWRVTGRLVRLVVRGSSFDDLVGAFDELTRPGDPPTSLVP